MDSVFTLNDRTSKSTFFIYSFQSLSVSASAIIFKRQSLLLLPFVRSEEFFTNFKWVISGSLFERKKTME